MSIIKEQENQTDGVIKMQIKYYSSKEIKSDLGKLGGKGLPKYRPSKLGLRKGVKPFLGR